MIYIYTVLFTALFFALLPLLFFFVRIRPTIFKRLYLTTRDPNLRESIWFHGASAGDILSIKPIIDTFYKEAFAKYNILITSNTESGRDIVKRYFPEDVKFAFMPFDLPFSVSRFFKIYKPHLLFLEASEFWPIVIHTAYRSGVKIVLINGNIKKERLFLYKILSYLSSNPFKRFDLMIVRNEETSESAQLLGVDKDKIIISGNTKYQNVFNMKRIGIPPQLNERFSNIDHLVVFGSIHYEEEEDILSTIYRIIDTIDNAKILVAPRHIERTHQLIDKIHTKTRSVSRFSDKQDTKITILDTMGDLFYLYKFACIAFVGGSLFDRGGHNVLEPAIWGVPVITGKYIKNFEDIVKELIGYGLIVVDNAQGLADVIIELLKDEEKRKSLSYLLSTKIITIKSDYTNLESILKKRFLYGDSNNQI